MRGSVNMYTPDGYTVTVRWSGIVWLFVILVVLIGSIQAQLSPGELHKSHESLEGMDNCGKCHSRDRSNLAAQCLDCHTAIDSRMKVGQGLHAQPGYSDCELCHVEHQGRDFNLIFFKGGEEAFDHRQTGYELRGRHAELTCRECHRPEFLENKAGLTEQSVAVERTYLGLDQDCLSCHPDQHREQLGDKCSNCHGFESWSPAPGFDHSKTSYALTGLHGGVACGKCHQTVEEKLASDSDGYVKYRGIAHESCTDCHRDAHEGRLGNECSRCHSTAGWRQVQAADFDHDQTRYPLRGLHTLVECRKCHSAGTNDVRLRYDSCMACHTDFHKGEFADRVSKGACEECHTVEGFRPAAYLLEQHDLSEFPLLGAHRAVPCAKCHVAGGYKFQYSSTRCEVCHRNPHPADLNPQIAAGGCEGCHVVDEWSRSVYDHGRSDFALTGKHVSVTCVSCHRSAVGNPVSQFSTETEGKSCNSCHRDVHGGQFMTGRREESAGCDRCHITENWSPSKFDHTKDARFSLDGAHARVACSSCHQASLRNDLAIVWYAPVDTSCAACHTGSIPERKADL